MRKKARSVRGVAEKNTPMMTIAWIALMNWKIPAQDAELMHMVFMEGYAPFVKRIWMRMYGNLP